MSYIYKIKYTDNVRKDQRCLLYCASDSSIQNGLYCYLSEHFPHSASLISRFVITLMDCQTYSILKYF